MAEEENIPVSPLDELGPQYGNLNPTNVDPTSYQAFEGDNIMDPQSEIPFAPLTPPTGLYRPQQQVRQKVVGNPPNQPPIKAKQKDFSKGAVIARANALGQEAQAVASTSQKRNTYGRIYSYNDGPDGDAFYDRYAGYGSEKIQELGFHPFRDNESLYNKNTTGWDDLSRQLSNSFLPLATRGFVSGPKSLYKIVTEFDFSPDTEDAEAYERAAAIGQSTKGGLGAFFNNTLMNFGYTAGIMTEALVEEAALGLLSPLTGGTSLLGTGAVLGKLGSRLKSVKGIGTGVNMAKGINNTLKSVNTYKGAKTFWNGTRTGKVMSSVGRLINPIENTMDAVRSFNKVDNLTSLAKGAKTVGAFYRDVRNLNMALAESRLEGGFTKNKVYNRLYEDYYRANGVTPDNDVQWNFTQQANTAATSNMIFNTALIFGTNKLVFPNITGPKGGIRSFLGSKIDDIKSFKHGSLKWTPKKGGIGGKFKYAENSLTNTLKSFAKDPLRKSIKGGLGYFKANFTEGFQEVAQEVSSNYYENYFVDSFKQKNREAFHFAEGSYDHATKEQYFKNALSSQLGEQGFETFASGFFMGMFAGPLNAAIPAMSTGYNKYFGDKKKYEEYKKVRKQFGEQAAASLNALYADPVKLFDSRLFNYSVQNAVGQVKQNGTTKEKGDAENEALISMVNMSLEKGSFDIFVDHLDSMKELPADEFEKTFGFEKGTGEEYQAKIDTVIDNAKEIKRQYEFYEERFPDPVDLSKFPDTDSQEYKQAAMLHMAWREAKKQAVFYRESYNDVAKRMVSIANNLTAKGPLKNITSNDVQVMLDEDALVAEISLLTGENSSLEGLTDEKSKELIKRNTEKIEVLKEFQKAKETFNKYFKKDKIVVEEGRKKVYDDKGKIVEDVPVNKEDIAKLKKEGVLERNETNDNKVTLEFKKAFSKYINFIADSNKEIVFDEQIEKAFEDIVDYSKLEDEKQVLAYYVNLMHNPKGFLNHVERNEEWMTRVYENKKEYFDGVVNNQIADIENNAVLNALYSQYNLLMEPAAFKLFMDEGVLPEYFIKNSTKQVYTKGTKEYNAALFLLLQNKDLKKLSVEEEVGEKDFLQEKINELKERKREEIDALPGEEKQVKVEEILPQRPLTSFKIGAIQSKALEGERIVATIAQSKDKVTLRKENGNLVNQAGEIVNEMDDSFEKAIRYTTTIERDAKEVAKIEKKYEALEKELVENFEKNQETSIGRFTNDPTATNLRRLSPRVYKEVFEEMQQDEDYGPQYKESTSQQQKNNLINSYIRDNFKSIKSKLGVKEEVKKKAPEKAPEKSKLEQEVDALKASLANEERLVEKNLGTPQIEARIKELKQEIAEKEKQVAAETKEEAPVDAERAKTKTKEAPKKAEVKKGEQDPEATKIELSENEAINKRVEKAKAAIAKAEANELSNIMLDLSSKYGNIPIQIQEEVLFPLVEERFKELSISTKKEETKLEGSAVPKSEIYKEGTTLIVTGKIRPKLGPGKWNYDKLTNSTVTIEKMTKDGAELNIVINGKNKKYSATFGELEKNYTLPALVNTEVEKTEPMTKQEKTDVKQSKKVSEDFLSDSEAQNKALKKAENTTIEDAKNNLRNNLKCRKK